MCSFFTTNAQKQIEIIHADDFIFNNNKHPDYGKLVGNVSFKHEGAIMQCDSAYQYKNNKMDAFGNIKINQGDTLYLSGKQLFYDGNSSKAIIKYKVRLIDKHMNLTTEQINYDLENQLGLKRNEFKLAGILILFNNLLQSLFKSQILTLGVVMVGITLMFLILFRNITLSLIGVVPNFMAAFLILGIIGLLEIPLDMMTITIAAITIGIAVDNSIHYIYRFKEEFKKINNYNQTLEKCHETVGVAILNTSITIVFGFSILVMSNFIPTIYFGVFTGIAMLLAMISVLTLLPKLILIIKPFGLERINNN